MSIATKLTRLIILAKAPLPTMAKTRLAPALGDEGAAQLAKKMLHHIVAEATLAAASNASLQLELCVAPSVEHPFWSDFQANHPTLKFSSQGEGDLGQRMSRCAQRALLQGENCLLIGTDCPALTASVLQQATTELDHHQAVICPTFDGGYSLLGLTCFEPSVFENMPWSTAAVAPITLGRLRKRRFSVCQLEPLHDIDTPDDLTHLPSGWLNEINTNFSITNQ